MSGFMDTVHALVDGIRTFFRVLYSTPPGC